MRTRTKFAVAFVAVLGLGAFVALALVDAREMGRTNPKTAANFRPLSFNFDETYRDGAALGVAVGSKKAAAIAAAERAGLTVEPSGWGDTRAGGASLYEWPELLATMLRQPYLNFRGPVGGMTVHFQDDRVAAIRVTYINMGI